MYITQYYNIDFNIKTHYSLYKITLYTSLLVTIFLILRNHTFTL